MTRKIIVAFSLMLLWAGIAAAQILTPVKWSFRTEQKNDAEAVLVFTAHIDDGFHIYSLDISPDAGPIPTSFTFTPNAHYSLAGKTTESKAVEVFDPNFGVQVKYHSGNPEFRQKIRIKNTMKFTVAGSLTYMSCDDSKCLPPEDVDFSFIINPDSKAEAPAPADEMTGNTDAIQQTESSSQETESVVPVSSEKEITTLEPGCGTGEGEESHDMSFWGIFIAGAIGGLLALLTPCVFPMIPLTVSFFTKRSKSRRKSIFNALFYGISIILIYVVLGLLVTVVFGSDALNDMASNGFFNLLFFVIFLIFAISFFGVFEITLPNALLNKADKASDRGGLIGIFFMAFTLSLVSFSCTGPIIGTLLVEAAHGRSYIGPIAGMFGFAFALAVPFGVFAMFPGWLHMLPKSGGWLNTVKVSLGFIELALALKFLSNVDLAYHWDFLKREIYIVLWVVIFTLMGVYLLGKLRLSHDSEVKHVSIGRLMFAILAFSFALYLTPGIWGAPLKFVSGFVPPEFYKEWTTAKSEHCPHDLMCFHDYEEGMRYAKAQGKPVILDFTGWSCVNCRKMEDHVWSDGKVLERLRDKYVLISLYVDDKRALPENEQHISATTGKKIKTIGNKWSDFQAKVYNTNSQPFYVLLDNGANMLAHPRGYTPDIAEYTAFLDEGLCRYEKRKNSIARLAE